ncbi:MAG: cyclic lactone autoinducer peptide [Muricomes sp.]
MMDKKIKKALAEVIAVTSYKMAEKNANSACIFLHGQPKMPDSVKSMKKSNK